jgi:hypothetical protein
MADWQIGFSTKATWICKLTGVSKGMYCKEIKEK